MDKYIFYCCFCVYPCGFLSGYPRPNPFHFPIHCTRFRSHDEDQGNREPKKSVDAEWTPTKHSASRPRLPHFSVITETIRQPCTDRCWLIWTNHLKKKKRWIEIKCKCWWKKLFFGIIEFYAFSRSWTKVFRVYIQTSFFFHTATRLVDSSHSCRFLMQSTTLPENNRTRDEIWKREWGWWIEWLNNSFNPQIFKYILVNNNNEQKSERVREGQKRSKCTCFWQVMLMLLQAIFLSFYSNNYLNGFSSPFLHFPLSLFRYLMICKYSYGNIFSSRELTSEIFSPTIPWFFLKNFFLTMARRLGNWFPRKLSRHKGHWRFEDLRDIEENPIFRDSHGQERAWSRAEQQYPRVCIRIVDEMRKRDFPWCILQWHETAAMVTVTMSHNFCHCWNTRREE